MTDNREMMPLLALTDRNEKLVEHRQVQQLRSRWGDEGSSSSAAAVPLSPRRTTRKPRSRLPGLDLSHLHIQICHVRKLTNNQVRYNFTMFPLSYVKQQKQHEMAVLTLREVLKKNKFLIKNQKTP